MSEIDKIDRKREEQFDGGVLEMAIGFGLIAISLGIDPRNKPDEELLEEIRSKLNMV